MKATDVLRKEHDIALKTLLTTELEMRSMKMSGMVNVQLLGKIMDFFTIFLVDSHHRKEEQHLFALMQGRGINDVSIPLAVLRHEHMDCKRKISFISGMLQRMSRGEQVAVVSLSDQITDFIYLLQDHIAKENNVLFPLAEQLFTPLDHLNLVEEFVKVEAEIMCRDGHERYQELAVEFGK